MEAVGQLTGGIAHDFNNILAIILGNVELLRAYLPHDAYADEIIDTVLRATIHGRDLTGHLLAFSRRRLLNPQPVDVNGLVESIVRLLGRTLGVTVRVTTVTSAEAGVAFVDPAALEAAVLNVALNARDAMPDGGTLTIRTSRVDLDRSPNTDDDLEPGAYATLALEDTGSGMSADVIARVFEPFFTTKTGGRGTGLGLSMVYGFAKQSGGTVTIESNPGRASTVTMFLPIAGPDQQSPTIAAGRSRAPTMARTILVVEDEADVRTIVRRQLESLGHRVLVAEGATEALLLIQGPGAPDLLLTDVVLTGRMNGIELANAAARGATRTAGHLHVRLHRGGGGAAAHARDRRAAALETVHHAAARARRQRRLFGRAQAAEMKRPLPFPARFVAAHRGSVSAAAPENTLDAFAAAIAAGADAIELDVRRLADGELVIFHDAAIGERRLRTLTRAEIDESAPHRRLLRCARARRRCVDASGPTSS